MIDDGRREGSVCCVRAGVLLLVLIEYTCTHGRIHIYGISTSITDRSDVEHMEILATVSVGCLQIDRPSFKR